MKRTSRVETKVEGASLQNHPMLILPGIWGRSRRKDFQPNPYAPELDCRFHVRNIENQFTFICAELHAPILSGDQTALLKHLLWGINAPMRLPLLVLACGITAFGLAQNTPPPASFPVLPVDAPFKDPGRNIVVWDQSPNFSKRPGDAVIDTIVLHHTASSALPGVVKWFRNTASQVSAHFTIGKDGSIVQHVSTFDRAWHAGVSVDAQGRRNVNNFSVGIEIVNKGDGSEPWTEEQLNAVEHIVSVICRRHPITQIVSHEFIAQPPGRKNDPINFPWDRMARFGKKISIGKNVKVDL